MPRRASCAARIVPENPPPTIATGACRSDFIIGPILRVRRAGLARLYMVVDSGHGPPGGFREPAGHRGMDNRGTAGADQLGADLDRPRTVRRPAHAERSGMRENQAVDE